MNESVNDKKQLLSNWLITSGVLKKNGKSENMTHLLLNGGVAYIGDNRMKEFHLKYKEYLENVIEIQDKTKIDFDIKKNKQEKIYLCEIPTDVFRYFIDLDYKNENEMKDDFYMNIITNIISVIKQYYNIGLK